MSLSASATGIYGPGIHISGNFATLSTERPDDWEIAYKIRVPFDFKWRHKIGNVECTCTECEEHYQPWYGWSYYHSPECEMMKYVQRRPQILNLWQYAGRDITLIAQID